MTLIKVVPVGPFQCNCLILADAKTRDAIVIDPGAELNQILAFITEQQLNVRTILHTHTHIDHIGGTKALQQLTAARVLLHERDLFLYEKMDMQARFLGLNPESFDHPVPPDGFLKDGEALEFGNNAGVILHTPGHTPGSCGFFFPNIEQVGLLAAGDTLFAGSIGRTDLWQGDYDQEIESIKKKYLTLPEEVIVIPGHGPATTIGQEKRSNPFLIG